MKRLSNLLKALFLITTLLLVSCDPNDHDEEGLYDLVREDKDSGNE